jgi:hypothetical protein
LIAIILPCTLATSNDLPPLADSDVVRSAIVSRLLPALCFVLRDRVVSRAGTNADMFALMNATSKLMQCCETTLCAPASRALCAQLVVSLMASVAAHSLNGDAASMRARATSMMSVLPFLGKRANVLVDDSNGRVKIGRGRDLHELY